MRYKNVRITQVSILCELLNYIKSRFWSVPRVGFNHCDNPPINALDCL